MRSSQVSRSPGTLPKGSRRSRATRGKNELKPSVKIAPTPEHRQESFSTYYSQHILPNPSSFLQELCKHSFQPRTGDSRVFSEAHFQPQSTAVHFASSSDA